jgi:hypothetical protein
MISAVLHIAFSFVLIFHSFDSKERNFTIYNECEIITFYKGVEEAGSNDIFDFSVKKIVGYVPLEMEKGRYAVEVASSGFNFYRIVGTNYFFKTRTCYDISHTTKAYLYVEEKVGSTAGKVRFY